MDSTNSHLDHKYENILKVENFRALFYEEKNCWHRNLHNI